MSSLGIIILAAGQGSRMKSTLPKVLHPLAGNALIDYPLRLASYLNASPLVLVLGHAADQIQKYLEGFNSVQLVYQKEQLGTAHAVLQAKDVFSSFENEVLILSGDVPMLEKTTLEFLIQTHRKNRSAISLASFKTKNPQGYGRIVRGDKKQFLKIVEEKNATENEKKIQEVNAGLYVADAKLLFESLQKVDKNAQTGEYYLTQVPEILSSQGAKVEAFCFENEEEFLGINTQEELAKAEKKLQKKIKKHLMQNGVHFVLPKQSYVEFDVEVGAGTCIEPGVQLKGQTKIASHCHLEAGVVIKNSVLEEGVLVKAYSYLENSYVASDAQIGPFAHLRPGSHLGEGAKVGNFVELKKTKLGKGSKANHLSYLGDAEIGEEVNIGAGTITCNYDGVLKFKTVIENKVFIGSDSQLIAPVKVGEGAYIGAGTTVTHDVPAGSLALSRTPQVDIVDYVKKKKE